MKTDSIFYRLFQTLPSAFFELLNRPAAEANTYQFSSVEVKETSVRIDGLFLPDSRLTGLPIYFLEVQFQKDPELFARLFFEVFLYLRFYAPTKPWRAVVIFARRSMEPTDIEPYQVLLNSPLVTRLYLNELGSVTELPLGIGLIKLVVETKRKTTESAKQLVEKTRSEVTDEVLQRNVLELIETIVLYKLPLITRQELAKMFTTLDFKRTRYYQEVREEVKEEVREEVKEEVREEVKEEVREEVKEEVRQQTQQARTLELITRQLSRRVGTLTPEWQQRLQSLSLEQLDHLAEDLLDFSNVVDLETWFENLAS